MSRAVAMNPGSLRTGRSGLALTAALAVACWSCSAPAPLDETEILSLADREFESRNFPVAVDRYRELLNQHPFSDQAETARFRIAHAYYLNKEYDAAIAAFNDFERLHPTSPKLPFVEYTVGMCHLDQALMADRDQSSSEKALRQFERLRRRYPNSVYGRLAAFRIEECREKLAAHELKVGDFYFKSGSREAGTARYRFILDRYPDTAAAAEAAARMR